MLYAVEGNLPLQVSVHSRVNMGVAEVDLRKEVRPGHDLRLVRDQFVLGESEADLLLDGCPDFIHNGLDLLAGRFGFRSSSAHHLGWSFKESLGVTSKRRGLVLQSTNSKVKLMPRPPLYITKPIGGEKNGGTRQVRTKKRPAYYATQLNRKKRKVSGPKTRVAPLRKSLTPGTVCIVLAGLHKGKRVVFLKRLTQGLCLITGPFKINACPLRRVNQIYLIATATKLDISGLEIPKYINDKYFRRSKKPSKSKKEEGDIFEKKTDKYVCSDERKRDQALVDKQIIEAIKKREDKKMLFGYLGTCFGLRSNMYPHLLKF